MNGTEGSERIEWEVSRKRSERLGGGAVAGWEEERMEAGGAVGSEA